MVCERVNVLLNLNAHLLFDEVWLPPELLLIGEQHPYRPIYFLGSFAR
uniref:Uncharacterized protein n=1 Tax=Arundo donax TaxID=35708 RepID=A0A0A9BUE6_ARUDO